MSIEGNEHIDELFRKGLTPEHDPVAYQESEWAKLEERLEQRRKRKGLILWLKPTMGAAALILLALSIWMLWPTSTKTPKQQVASEEPAIEQPKKEPSQPSNQLKEATAVPKNKPLISTEIIGSAPQNTKSIKPVSNELLAEKAIPVYDSMLIANPEIKRVLPLSPSIPVKPVTSELVPIQAVSRFPKPNEENEDLILAKPTHEHNLTLSLLVAPSYNDVDNLSNGKLGSDVGILVSYGLTKKWSLSSGAVYAKKLYEASPTSYKLNTGNYHPQKVNADCRVLDIPLNVNYTLISNRNMAFSFGTGISSYIMLKEDYSFVYSNYNNNVEVVNQNRHWLAIFNLQANLERKLSSKISVSFQPYLKVPMKEIGYAKVKLQSFGLALGANWNL